MTTRTPHRIIIVMATAILLLIASCSEPAYIRKNDLLIADGRLDKAAANYRQMIAEDPEEGELYYQLARVLLAGKDYAGAMKAIDKAIIIDRLIDRYQLLAGKISFTERSYFDAINYLTNAATLNPQMLEAYYYLGLAYQHTGQTDKALEQFQTALAIEPLYFDARLAWARVRFRQLSAAATAGEDSATTEQSVKSLAETLETTLAIKPASVPGNLLLSDIYLSLGADLKARTLLEKRITEFGSNDRILLALAKLDYREGRFDKARQLLSQLVEPNLQSRLLTLRIALRSESPEGAAELTQLLKHHPGSAELQLLAAQQELQQGNPGQAERLVQKSLEISPDYAEAYYTLSRVYTELNDSSGAAWTLKKALQLAPANIEIRLAWLHSLLEQGKWQEAEKQLAHFALDAKHPEVMYIRGVIAEEKGDDKTAEQLFQEVAQMQYTPRTEVQLARIETRRGQYQAAEKRLLRVNEFFPNNLEVALARAELMMQSKRSSKIPAILTPYLSAKKGRGRVHLALAESRVQAGQIDAALKILGRAVQRWPRNPDLVQAYTLYLGLSGRYSEAVPLLEEMQRSDHKFSRLFFFRLREYYYMSGNKKRFRNYYRYYRLDKNRVRRVK